MRIGIYGAGIVGSTIAYTLNLLNLAEEIYIYDSNYKKVIANIFDIQDALYHNIYYCNIEELYKCDLIVVCVGNSQLLKEKEGRNKEKEINNKAIKILCSKLKERKYNGFIINVSNPNDVISYEIYKILKNKNKIIGTGTWLDTNRFQNISKYVSIVGEHGKGQINNNYKTLVNDRYNSIIEGKGYTNFAISKIVSDIVKILQQNKPQKVILSVLENEKFTSKEVILNNEGVIDVLYTKKT